MDDKNVTRITNIHLLGFQTPKSIKNFIFFLFLIIYCVTVGGNLTIIILISYSKILHSPMYIFLSQLSTSDILLVTDIVPNILRTVLVQEMIISFLDCVTQYYFFAVSGGLECFLLTVMSYDRYLAICRPLHYTLIMNHRFCWIMIFTSWVLSIVTIMIFTLTMLSLQFCGPNVIDHFFCDLSPILELSCSDTTILQLQVTVSSALFVVIPFFIIIVSYCYILVTILQIPSITGRKKAFSTCSSHLIVVSIYYGTLVCVYLVPSTGQSWNITKFLSLFYTIVTPLMNPIVYSLRNKDLRKSAEQILKKILENL
ncbi:olfactory receptor 10A7-like [Hyperolius riggenbachi]|uniref:olfactory receptor 10A7-like n=1 Tax=Hyperolius riggenbachi TaxID=752182 RepID=UPI0035A3CCA2